MKLKIIKKDYAFTKKDTAIIFISQENVEKKIYNIPESLNFINDTANLSLLKGKAGEITLYTFKNYPRVIFTGIGKSDEIDKENLRNSSAALLKICIEKELKEITIFSPENKILNESETVQSIAEGLSLANYSFDKYKIDDKKILLKTASFITDNIALKKLLIETEVISDNTLLCRDLVNETSDNCTPKTLASIAESFAKIDNVSATIYNKSDIKKMKMGLLLAVNRGSENPPHLIVLKYQGDSKSKKFFSIVGKGITFDSGGLNLKPSGSIETMRMDMAGAAATLYAFKTAAELKLKKNIYAVIPTTDNMLNNKSYRPGDIFTAYNGKTVEIGNTDAEGRLILADALAFTVDKLKPDYIIDLATLTGACLVTFGETTAAYLTESETLSNMITVSSENTGDRVWQLPLFKDYDEGLKSDIAALNNISSEKQAGTITGASFLKNFVDKTKWVHIDIAGTAWYSKPRGYRPKNATGFGVRLIIDIIKNWNGK